MSKIFKTLALMLLLAVFINLNIQLNDWFFKTNLKSTLEQQLLINKSFNNKIDELQQTVDYLEFSLDINNRLIEELLSDQIQKKGDE